MFSWRNKKNIIWISTLIWSYVTAPDKDILQLRLKNELQYYF